MMKINPNLITSLRLVIFTPASLICIMHGWLGWALLAMILGEFTDYIDGMHARNTNQISNLGKLYDPMCDSIHHMAMWVSFLALGWINVYFVVLFLARESIVSTMRTYMASHSIVLAARKTGKLKALTQALVQMVIVALHWSAYGLWSFLSLSRSMIDWMQSGAILFVAIVVMVSLCDYLLYFYSEVKAKRVLLN